MTRKAFENRVHQWRARLLELGLAHWDLHFEYAESDDEVTNSVGRGAEATVTVNGMYDTAHLHIPPSTLKKPKREIDRVIVHELMHILFRDLTHAQACLLDVVGGQLADQFDTRLDHEMEGIVERLARSIVALSESVVP